MSTATLTAAASGSGSQGLGTAFRLVKLTFRGGASRSTLVLPIVAFGLTTALLLTVLAGALSFFRWTDEIAGFYQVLVGIWAAPRPGCRPGAGMKNFPLCACSAAPRPWSAP